MAFDLDDPLIAMSAVELKDKLERREISSEDIVRAHLDRIVTIDGRMGAFTETLRGEAFGAARRADEARARGDARGPLFGLPLSIKENLDYEGRASTLGIVARKNKLATRHATIVKGVLDAGMIPLGRTNVPQLLLSHETRNPVFAPTINAFSDAHTPGGSSGGEATAIASGMSPFGVGTDIGGSIRVPAHWSGIVGFKPTLDRWPTRGSNGGLPGQEAVRSQVGPMARSVADLLLLLRGIDLPALAADDPNLIPMPYDDPANVDVRLLKVGVFIDDGVVSPSASVARAVVQAKDALERRGIRTVSFVPPRVRDAVGLYFALLSSDGGRTAWGQLEGGPGEPTLAPLRKLASLPGAARIGLARVLRSMGEERASYVLSQLGDKSVQTYWALTRAARVYRMDLLDAMKASGVDVLLCPPHATAAVPHGMSAQFQLAGSYSMLFNLVQFPCGVVPVTTVAADETSGRPETDRIDRIACAVEQKSEGLPLGVQIAAAPFKDEIVLAVMAALEAALDKQPDRPKVPRAPKPGGASASPY